MSESYALPALNAAISWLTLVDETPQDRLCEVAASQGAEWEANQANSSMQLVTQVLGS